MGKIGSIDDVTEEDEREGIKALNDGSTAFVVIVHDVELSLKPIQGLGLSLVGWKLLTAGMMPTWLIVPSSEEKRRVLDHVSTFALPPGFSGAILEPGDWQTTLDDNQRVQRITTCRVDNLLACPDPRIVGWHIRSGNVITREITKDFHCSGNSVIDVRCILTDDSIGTICVHDMGCLPIRNESDLSHAGEIITHLRLR